MEHAQRDAIIAAYHDWFAGLNPYFNGTCSKRLYETSFRTLYAVLILILMEYAQREFGRKLKKPPTFYSLNPYFNGTCSKRTLLVKFILCLIGVLILILMEHA